MAAELYVVHLEIRHRATELTPPDITTQNLPSHILVRHVIKPGLSQLPKGCGTVCGAPRDSTSCHRIDTSRHHDAEPAVAYPRTPCHQAGIESAPEGLRNCMWCTSRFDIVPQN